MNGIQTDTTTPGQNKLGSNSSETGTPYLARSPEQEIRE